MFPRTSFTEHISPRRSKYQVRSAHGYREINNGVGWNIANCVTGEKRVSNKAAPVVPESIRERLQVIPSLAEMR